MVVLVGVPGSGKTTVGTALAQSWGVGFRDTDADVEAAVGKSIADQFVEDGEPAFRERERIAVASALDEHDGVLSLGGGAVLDAGTRALLVPQRVVWLQASASEAANRVGMGAARPVLMGNVRSRLVTLLAERTPLYEEVSDLVVDTDGSTAAGVAEAVSAWLRASP